MKDYYEARNSIYCYPNSNVLVNKLEIQDMDSLTKYETQITGAKLLALRQQGVSGNFSMEHLIQIHTFLFEDIYPFAGKFRCENIAKGSFRFAEWEYIQEELEKILMHLKEEKNLLGLDRQTFIKRLAYYMAELNVLHPFREGNGRTIREFIRQLALENGYYLDIRKIKPKQMLEACIISVVDTKKLEDLLEECLEKKGVCKKE